MLKPVWFAIKIGLFVLLVLVMGNLIYWRGRTISDQVRSQISHAEHIQLTIPAQVKEFSKDLGSSSESKKSAKSVKKQVASTPANVDPKIEEISQTERQKLRTLIQELNR